jgi:hypothetical protein
MSPAHEFASPPFGLLFLEAHADALLATADGKLAAARAPTHTQQCQLEPHEHLHGQAPSFSIVVIDFFKGGQT